MNKTGGIAEDPIRWKATCTLRPHQPRAGQTETRLIMYIIYVYCAVRYGAVHRTQPLCTVPLKLTSSTMSRIWWSIITRMSGLFSPVNPRWARISRHSPASSCLADKRPSAQKRRKKAFKHKMVSVHHIRLTRKRNFWRLPCFVLSVRNFFSKIANNMLLIIFTLNTLPLKGYSEKTLNQTLIGLGTNRGKPHQPHVRCLLLCSPGQACGRVEEAHLITPNQYQHVVGILKQYSIASKPVSVHSCSSRTLQARLQCCRKAASLILKTGYDACFKPRLKLFHL